MLKPRRGFLTLALLLCLLGSAGSSRAAQSPPVGGQPAPGTTPWLIIENRGQFDPAVRFAVPLRQGQLLITADALWLTVWPEPTAAGRSLDHRTRRAGLSGVEPAGDGSARPGVHLRLTFPDARPDLHPTGFGSRDVAVSSFRGSDPANWQADLPVWTGIRWPEIAPGVDLELTGADGGPSLRYVVHGDAATGIAALDAVRWRFEGADSLSVTADGYLLLHTPAGDIPWPLAEIGEAGPAAPRAALRPASARGDGSLDVVRPFLARDRSGATEAGVALAAQDAPDLAWSSILGGAGDDYAAAVTRDTEGALYITGYTSSADLPATPGVFQPKFGGNGGFGFGGDAFVAKYAPDGATLRFLTYLGGDDSDFANALALDGAGNVYLTGQTASRNFPTTPGVVQPRFSGPDRYGLGIDAFVAKLGLGGTKLEYSTYLGGTDSVLGVTIIDSGNAIAVDSAGSAYVAGYTNSQEFPTTPDAFQQHLSAAARPAGDAFFTQLSPTAATLVYSTFLGGRGDDGATGLALDAAGRAFLTGWTDSADFPVSAGAFQRTLGGDPNAAGRDAFLVRFDPGGSVPAYSTYLGGSGDDSGAALTLDTDGSVYLAGSTASTNFPVTAGAFQTTGRFDAFATKFNAAGGALDYSTFLGGSRQDDATALALDGFGQLYIAGTTTSPDFPVTAGAAFQSTARGQVDGFLVKLDSAGSGLLYGTYLGGRSNDIPRGVAVDGEAAAYLAGNTTSTDFPWRPGGFTTNYQSDRLYGDVFLTKLETATTRLPDAA